MKAGLQNLESVALSMFPSIRNKGKASIPNPYLVSPVRTLQTNVR